MYRGNALNYDQTDGNSARDGAKTEESKFCLTPHTMYLLTLSIEWDADDLAREASLARKLRQGKITKADYEAALADDDDMVGAL